jgi:hypothetical protein
MSQAHPRPGTRHASPRASGATLAVAAGVVLVALIVVPWLAGRSSTWPYAPAVAVLLALPPALYLWFRRAQQTPHRTAVTMGLVYGVLAAAALWLWKAL